ncbi:membrane protein [soil metagenome]
MLSLKLITKVRFCVILLILFSFEEGYSQINSPYSRYGLGDIYNSRNVVSKAMGNLATPLIDYQAVNFINPASYSRLQSVSFDVGIEFESRSLRNLDRTENYKSNNLYFNYVTIGVPLLKDKAGISKWGMAFGLRPMTRMNYNISQSEYQPGIDSIGTIYKGSGGASKAFIGTGFKVKGLSLGANVGFLFGQQNISTQRTFLNDTVQYFTSNHESQLSYNKLYFDMGAQYDIKLGKKSTLRLGVSGFVGGKVNASTDILRETIVYNNTGEFDSLDVVSREKNVNGEITMPSGYTVGFMLDKTNVWMLGAEYERINWDDYRYYGNKDNVGTTGMLRIGGQWIPSLSTKKYFNRITYRAGFYTGTDYVKVDGKQLPIWAGTVGFGFPVRRWNNYSNQYTVINTSLEYGKRGNGTQPVTENFFRLNIGLCLSDLWFNKRKFD